VSQRGECAAFCCHVFDLVFIYLVAEYVLEYERVGADVSEFEFTARLDTPGWFSSMDNFVTLLTKGGYIELVSRIMELELPTRKSK